MKRNHILLKKYVMIKTKAFACVSSLMIDNKTKRKTTTTTTRKEKDIKQLIN